VAKELAMLQRLTGLRRQEEVDGRAVTIKKKFVLALIAYAVLGVLAWTTLSDEPIRVFNANVRLRSGTLLVLGLFAFRAALYYWRTRIEEERAGAKPAE
jgi:asparagine N-glycosylation enzyme membrane subunit Stt3